MASYKCKMCGGTLEVRPGESVCECEYCGTKQTIPSVMEENLQNLFNRANVLRMKAEFDKAAEIYERIVQADESEAEAYWGLVLCKYGVEYVEDPSTFQRILTCHRTSYEAVTADADYRSAIEHADASQRQIYESEARTIDEIQKGILAVAKRESPYDVFICYKEADENGKRTVDSTIANDIYYQLTQEGFKVFYSAITLEDKLGEEYEPYIFSALNSAKVMLVLGTKPEYFTAVWVKNEWSRFLKLMQNDRSRTLIPCFRDMDAYELPEEFAHLQAEDMTKIGFMNDIIRGIKKLIAVPEGNAGAVPQTPQSTQTVVQGGNVNVEALLKRGNMSLEDRDWDKANEYFNRVLDLDAECAAAYLGIVLEESRVASLDEWAKSIGPMSVTPHVETLQAGKHDTEAESRIVSQNLVSGYLDHIQWEPFDFRFSSTKSGWISARNSVESRMGQNKNLNRAAQYGDAVLRRQIDDCKKAILADYDAKITEAKRQDETRKAVISKEYTDFLNHQEELAGQQRQKAEENREEDYQRAIAAFTQSKIRQEHIAGRQTLAQIRQEYIVARQTFTDEKLKDYKDSAKCAEECTARIAELDAKEEREAAQKREKEKREAAQKREKEKREAAQKQEKKKRCTRIGIIVTIVAVVVIALLTQVIIPSRKYDQAVAMMDDGQYEDAIEAFTALGGFKDSGDLIQKVQDEIEEAQKQSDYEDAKNLLDGGYYEDAIEAFSTLGDYEDAEEQVLDAQRQWYEVAETYLEAGNYDEAIDVFSQLGDYVDSEDRVLATQYELAEAYVSNGDMLAAATTFGKLGDYLDASDRSMKLWKNRIKKNSQVIACGFNHTVALKSDGTVVAAGNNYSNQCDVSDWTDIVSISTGGNHTVGLKADGTVVATGNNSNGQCDVSGWAGIVAISASQNNTVGLKADGTVVAVGKNYSNQCDVSDWTDIVSISTGGNHTVGLKADGTVVATGYNSYGECDVSDWTDIVDVAAGAFHTIGIKMDGTIVALGSNKDNECAVYNEDWTDVVSVMSGGKDTFGLKIDGSVVATGYNDFGECNVSGWRNIVAISCGGEHTAGVLSNGKVIATGYNGYGECDVSGWTDILVP